MRARVKHCVALRLLLLSSFPSADPKPAQHEKPKVREKLSLPNTLAGRGIPLLLRERPPRRPEGDLLGRRAEGGTRMCL